MSSQDEEPYTEVSGGRPWERCCGGDNLEKRQRRATMFTFSPWVFFAIGVVALAAFWTYFIVGWSIPKAICTPYMLYGRPCPEEIAIGADNEITGIVQTLECIDDGIDYCMTTFHHKLLPISSGNIPEAYALQFTVRGRGSNSDEISKYSNSHKAAHAALVGGFACVEVARSFMLPAHPTAIVAAHTIPCGVTCTAIGVPNACCIINPPYAVCVTQCGNDNNCIINLCNSQFPTAASRLFAVPTSVPAAPVANTPTLCTNTTNNVWTSGLSTEYIVLGGSAGGANLCHGVVGTVTDGQTASGAIFSDSTADWFKWDTYSGYTWGLREPSCTADHEHHSSDGDDKKAREVQNRLRPGYISRDEMHWITLPEGDYSWLRGSPGTNAVTASLVITMGNGARYTAPIGQSLLGELLK